MLYFSLGQHLSAGYASVPPFTGFIAWIMINISGYSLLSARIIPMILSGVFILIGSGITKELKGGNYARILVSVALFITPFNLRSFLLFQPVCFEIIFWSLVFWLILKWINTNSDKYILILGLVAGIGLLNKYLIGLEIAGIFVALIFSQYRSIITKRSFYLSVLIALIVISPNLIWQVKNNFPAFTHIHALHDSQLVYVNRLNFFTDQLFMASVSIFLFIPGILYLCFSKSMLAFRPLVFASLLVLVCLAILRGKSYYTIGLFPLWISAGAVFWERIIRWNILKVLFPVLLLLFSYPVLPMGIPIHKSEKLALYFENFKINTSFNMVLRWEDGNIHDLPQDYADMIGWDELAALTSKAYELVSDKKSIMIYAENYGQAGAVMVLGKKYNLPEPACFSESFFYWIPRNPENEITSLIYINSELGGDVNELFSECREIGVIQNPQAREYGTGVWLCTKPLTSFNDFWKDRISQVKNPF